MRNPTKQARKGLIQGISSVVLMHKSRPNIRRDVSFMSPSLAKLLGYPQKEMINTSFARYIYQQELLRLAGYYLKRISGGEAPPIYNAILRRRNGKYICVELIAGIFPFYGKPADLVITKEIVE